MHATHMKAAFLRGVAHVPMAPFRAQLEAIGFADVRSFGATGNFVFAGSGDRAELERRIEEATGFEAFVRTQDELARVVTGDPYAGLDGAGVFFGREAIPSHVVEAFARPGFDGPAPVIVGADVYFVYPIHRPGKQMNLDFERELGVRGTMRASRVVARVLGIM